MPSPARANGASVVKFKPVAVKNKPLEEAVAEIARGVNALHECVHVGQAAQAERDQETGRKLESLASKVGEVQTRQEYDSGRITKLAQMFGAADVEPGEKRPKAAVKLSWGLLFKFFGALSGIILFIQLVVPALVELGRQIMAVNP